ncbi:unnamed protein product [Rhizophagus irregularis]|nr:unnamed protein product [Rhizophagus irregularis]
MIISTSCFKVSDHRLWDIGVSSWALIDINFVFGFSFWTLDRFQLLFLSGFSFLGYGEVNLPKYTNAYYLLKYYLICVFSVSLDVTIRVRF